MDYKGQKHPLINSQFDPIKWLSDTCSPLFFWRHFEHYLNYINVCMLFLFQMRPYLICYENNERWQSCMTMNKCVISNFRMFITANQAGTVRKSVRAGAVCCSTNMLWFEYSPTLWQSNQTPGIHKPSSWALTGRWMWLGWCGTSWRSRILILPICRQAGCCQDKMWAPHL